MRSFVRGLGIAFRGFRHAWRSKPLRRAYVRYVIALLALTFILELLALVWITSVLPEWVGIASQVTGPAQQTEGMTWADSILRGAQLGTRGLVIASSWTMGVVIWILSAIVAPYLAFALINALVPIFNDRILMSALMEVDPALHDRLQQQDNRPILKSFAYSMLRLARFIFVSLLISLCAWIPVFGIFVAPLMQFIWTAHNLSWEMLEPYFDRQNLHWSEQKALLAKHRAIRFGFATPAASLLTIPVVGAVFFGLTQASTAVLASHMDRGELRNATQTSPNGVGKVL